ncbi:MAG: winged helix-turn-helix domain-containing protein, partial [Solirubrobacteraceae bacterium]
YPELRLRLNAVLRRTRERRGRGRLRVGELELDPAAREVRLRGRRIALSQKEFALLRALAVEPTRVWTKEELLRDVWGFRTLGTSRHKRPTAAGESTASARMRFQRHSRSASGARMGCRWMAGRPPRAGLGSLVRMSGYRSTPEQEAVLAHPPDRHARLLAGPGTGKSATVVACRHSCRSLPLT